MSQELLIFPGSSGDALRPKARVTGMKIVLGITTAGGQHDEIFAAHSLAPNDSVGSFTPGELREALMPIIKGLFELIPQKYRLP